MSKNSATRYLALGCVFLTLSYNVASFIRPSMLRDVPIMKLASQDKKRFRTIAHALSPVVTIAQKGLSESVNDEIERALSQHELIKIKIFAADRESRKALTQEICATAKAELIQSIGNVAVIYRAAEKPNPKLSNILRFKAL